MWESLFQGFSELPKSEQFKLYNAIKFLLFPADQGYVAKIIKDIRESRFHEGHACLHCGSVLVKKNGKYRGRQ